MNPAVPSAIASNRLMPFGIGTSQSALSRAYSAVAAVMRDADVVARPDHRVALLEPRVTRLDYRARQVDPADARKAPDDPAGARSGECILIVAPGVADADHRLAGVELVDRHLLERAVTFRSASRNR